MNDGAILHHENHVSFFSDAHRFVRGGMGMEIKHTHPEYETSKQREAAIKDAKKAAISAIAALKGNVCRHSA